MRISLALIFIGFLATGFSSSADETDLLQFGPEFTECGELDRFWRARPVIGRWMSQGFLDPAPEFLDDSSFPYISRPYPMEVELADHLTTPRLLGGWHPDKGGKGELEHYESVDQADLVYRKADGSLGYRWHLLDLRLTRFVEMGYTDLTLVLDQIPYCFVDAPHLEKYGQATPPDNLQEWYIFIRDLCSELKRLYGEDIANGFRFRLGTELGHGTRIALSQDELHKMYALTAKAIKEVLPDAQLGPWNEAGLKNNQADAPLKYLELARFAKKQNLAFDFASISSYAIPKDRGNRVNNSDPLQKAEADSAFFGKVRELFPNIPAEIHEFGILNSQYNVVTSEPGARGAAYRAHYFLSMLEQQSLDLACHWDIFDSVAQSPNILLRSNGWLLSILEHAAGGTLSILQNEEEEPDSNFRYKSAVISSPERTLLIVTAYSVDRRRQDTREVRISIPLEVLEKIPPSSGTVQYVTLNPDHDVYRVLKSDLAKAGNLKPEYAEFDDLYANVKLMAKDLQLARKAIDAGYPRFKVKMVESLTLKPFPFKVETVDGCPTLTFPITTDSIYVFAW
ncbi:MAG: hypothetical protein AB3N63_05050 [Puniceicoccaceae bacterium]